MLTKVRIEVEEQTVAETVDALARYEAAIMTAEAQRFDEQWSHEYMTDPLVPGEARRVDPEPSYHWDLVEIPDYAFQLGRELVEEVIEYDAGLPGWKGRVVVRYTRLDGRSSAFVPLRTASGTAASGTGIYDMKGGVRREHGAGGDGDYFTFFPPGREPVGDDPETLLNT